jgi:hypothetical protein
MWPVQCFGFHPVDAGLVVIDVDRHEGMPDGAKTFAERWPEAWLVRWAIPYTKTPHNGAHFHFRYDGPKRFRSGDIAPGVECKHVGALVTAPGSIHPDEGLPYVLAGGFDDFPSIDEPPFLGIFESLTLHPSSPGYEMPKRENSVASASSSAPWRTRALAYLAKVEETSAGRQETVRKTARFMYVTLDLGRGETEDFFLSIPEYAALAEEDSGGFDHALRRV